MSAMTRAVTGLLWAGIVVGAVWVAVVVWNSSAFMPAP